MLSLYSIFTIFSKILELFSDKRAKRDEWVDRGMIGIQMDR